MAIRTSYVYPPIPLRDFDWCATYDDYDGVEDSPNRDHLGWGKTEQEAIDDLVEWFPREGEGACPDCLLASPFIQKHCASCDGTGIQPVIENSMTHQHETHGGGESK